MHARTLHYPVFARQLFLYAASLMLVVSCCYVSFAAPRAHAASLTEPQIQSILSLLVAFGVDQATVTNVDGILHGTAGANTTSYAAVPSADIPTTGALSLTASQKSNYQIVAGGAAQPVTVGQYVIHATGNNAQLTKLGVKLDSGSPADITGVSFYTPSGTLLGTTLFGAGQIFATSTLLTPLPLPQGVDTVLMVKATFSDIGVGKAGTEGDEVKIDPSSAEGIDSTGLISAAGTGQVPGVRVYNSYPTFAVSPAVSNSLTNGAQTLLSLNVTANSSGDISLYKLTFFLTTQGVTLSNVALYGPNGNVSSAYASVSSSGSQLTMYFNNPTNPADAVVGAGATKTYTLRGTVSGLTSANSGKVTLILSADSYPMTFATAASIDATGASIVWSPGTYSSYVAPTDSDWTNSYMLPGLPANSVIQSTAAVTPAATLSFSVDPSTPTFTTVAAGGSTQTIVGVYDVRAINGAVSLTKLGVKLSAGSPTDISGVSFYSDSGALLGSTVFGTGQTIATSTFTTPLSIAANTTAEITVKATFADIGTGKAGTEGDTVKIDPSSAEGTSATGLVQAGGSGSTIGVRIYNSLPSFVTAHSSGNLTNGTQDLLSLTASANSAGDIALYKLTFSLATQGVTLSNVTFSGPNGNVASSYASVSGNRVTVYFNSPVNTGDAQIGAGSSKTYTLRGVVSGLGSAGGKIILTLLADGSQHSVSSATDLDNSGANIIWSPLGISSSIGVATNDWTNGYGLSSLPTNSAVLQQAATTAAAAATCSISANKTSAFVGDTGVFTWATTNTSYVIGPNNARLNANGSQSVTFTSAGIYNYSVQPVGSNGTIQAPCAANVVVSPAPSATPAPTCTISANPSTVASGQPTTYTWSSTNSTSASLSNLGSVATSGSDNFAAQYFAFTTQGAHTETLTVLGPGGSATCNTVVNVTAPAAASDGVSPSVSSGAAPLTVTFSFNLNTAKTCGGGFDFFSYGDESGGGASEYPTWAAGYCGIYTMQTTHTYTKPGTYTATLLDGMAKTVWSQTITVSSSTAALARPSDLLASALFGFLRLFGLSR